jgi:hypothetical protein
VMTLGEFTLLPWLIHLKCLIIAVAVLDEPKEHKMHASARLRLLRATLGSLLAIIAPFTASAQTPPLNLCADFRLFSHGTDMPNDFVLAGFRFHKVVSGDHLMVHGQGSDPRGLVFSPSGVDVTLPIAANQTAVYLGVFAPDPVTIESLDSSGAPIGLRTFPQSNKINPEILSSSGSSIRYVRFRGGGGEGKVALVCLDVKLCEPNHKAAC